MEPVILNNATSAYSSKEFQNEMRHYLSNLNRTIIFIQGFIVLFGLLGNTLALIVINRKSLKNTSSAVYITYMAIFDSLVLILHAANLKRTNENPFIHCTLTYFTDLATYCANWVLVIITLERCVAVHFPFLAKRLCTRNSARYTMYIFLSLSTIFSSISFTIIYDLTNALTIKRCNVRPNISFIARIYQTILSIGIPDVLLLSNLFTVYTLCRRRERLISSSVNNNSGIEIRINDAHSSRKQRQLTIMLVTVSLSFYVFTTPAMIIFIRACYPRKITSMSMGAMKRKMFFSQISVVLTQLSNATNFIFYCCAGQRFRQATVQAFEDYSLKLKNFYYRYIRCNKEYGTIDPNRRRSSVTGNTLIMRRGSCSPTTDHTLITGSAV